MFLMVFTNYLFHLLLMQMKSKYEKIFFFKFNFIFGGYFNFSKRFIFVDVPSVVFFEICFCGQDKHPLNMNKN